MRSNKPAVELQQGRRGRIIIELQIPQRLEQSDEEDELYEGVEDTEEQHSQLTMCYMPCMPTSGQQNSKYK